MSTALAPLPVVLSLLTSALVTAASSVGLLPGAPSRSGRRVAPVGLPGRSPGVASSRNDLFPVGLLGCFLRTEGLEWGRVGRVPAASARAEPIRAPDGGSAMAVERLLGRRAECEALDRLLTDALAGRSGAAVLRGEAGVGKSALLRYLSDRAKGWHVARAEGVESEMELPYSGLHQICVPMLDRLDRLPVPQREALETVFGRTAGPVPDRFLVGLATLDRKSTRLNSSH